MHVFYRPHVSSAEACVLSKEESRYCVRVLRLQVSDRVLVLDGQGGLYEAVIQDAHPQRTVLSLRGAQRVFSRPNHYLHIAVAPTKNVDRMEWFL